MRKILIIAWGICFLGSLCACGNGSAPTADAGTSWQEQYDLGVRYLEEGNYEEAIIAFSVAIEIDPKRAPAYVGRGDSYTAQGERMGKTETACELYQKALADYERAVELGSTETQEKLNRLNDAIQQLQARGNAEPLLKKLYPLMDSGALEEAKALMRQEDYRAMSVAADEGCFAYSETEGICLAVYKNNCYYFGQWDSGQREGTGLWIQAAFDEDSDMESQQYEGGWRDDSPNGEGKITTIRYEDKIQVAPEHTTSVRSEVRGSFKNGLYDGAIYETWHMNTGEIMTWSPITAIDGVWQPMPDVPDELLDSDYARESMATGEYIVAIDDNGATLWGGGYTYSVFGCGED